MRLFQWLLPVVVTFSVGSTTYTENITAANAARLNAWAAATYPTVPNPAYIPQCGCADTIPNPQPGQSAFGAIIQGLKNNVTAWERDKARAAVVDPAPIN